MLALVNSEDARRPSRRRPLSQALADLLATLGIEIAFGVTGAPIAPFVHALEDHALIRWVPSRTEGGAVMEAIGAFRVTGRPVLVVTTCGPGILGTRQALEIAGGEGVPMVVVSPLIPAAERDRRAPQDARISADYASAGQVFDLVAAVEAPEQLAPLASALAAGLSRRTGFLAHVLVAGDLFDEPAPAFSLPRFRTAELAAGAAVVDEVIELLAAHRFFVLAGRGAHGDAELVRALVDVTGCPVVTTPGAKGVIDEHGSSWLGVTGIGGCGDVVARLRAYGAELALVLGSRLGGASVTPALLSLPEFGLVQVDRDPASVRPGGDVDTLFVQSELRPFLESLLHRRDRLVRRPLEVTLTSCGAPVVEGAPPAGVVRPEALMDAIQRVVVDGSDAPVLVDVGTSWPWATSLLRFAHPRRFRLESLVGSMGLAVSSAVGEAIGRHGKVVAITGDWSFDMALPELRTAVDQDAPVVWIVLQNFGGRMVVDGDREVHGRTESSARFRRADLAGAAQSFRAGATCVTAEADLLPALVEAMEAAGPYVVEVVVDTSRMPPYSERFDALRRK